MVRLMLTLTPCVCILSGIAFSKLFELYLKEEDPLNGNGKKVTAGIYTSCYLMDIICLKPIVLPSLMLHRNCLQAHLMESLKKLRARIRTEDYTIRPGKFGKFDMKIKKMMERVSKLIY